MTAHNPNFHCLSNQKCWKSKEKEGKKYSNIGAVFVITDGAGDYVKPENAKKWYWFLSENYTNCIPKNSNIFLLKDYE